MRLGVPGRSEGDGYRRTLALGLGSAFALALAAASSTAAPALFCWAVVAIGGGIAWRRLRDVGAIGLGGIAGYAVTGGFQLGQAGGPTSAGDVIVGAAVLGVIASILAGLVGLIRVGIVWLAGERDTASADSRATGQRSPYRRSRWDTNWLYVPILFAVGVVTSSSLLGLTKENVSGYTYTWAPGMAAVLVAAPILAVIGWGATALAWWRGSSAWSDILNVAIWASAVVAGIAAGAALHFAVGVSL